MIHLDVPEDLEWPTLSQPIGGRFLRSGVSAAVTSSLGGWVYRLMVLPSPSVKELFRS